MTPLSFNYNNPTSPKITVNPQLTDPIDEPSIDLRPILVVHRLW